MDDHVWYAHLGGVLPYRCGRCLRSFVSVEHMEKHWTQEHGDNAQPMAADAQPMDVLPNPSAHSKFAAALADCFPDISAEADAGVPSIVKAEPQDDQ